MCPIPISLEKNARQLSRTCETTGAQKNACFLVSSLLFLLQQLSGFLECHVNV